MLYEPPKTKKYILIGVAAIVLVVLILAVFSMVNKNKKMKTAAENQAAAQEKMQQKKIHIQLNSLDEAKKSDTNTAPEPTPENIHTDLNKLNEAQTNSAVIPSAKEEIKRQLDLLNNAK